MYSLVSHTQHGFSVACKRYDTQVHMAITGKCGGQCRQLDRVLRLRIKALSLKPLETVGGASGIVSRQTNTEWHGWHTTSTSLQNWMHTTRLVERNVETHCIRTPSSSSSSWALALYFAQQYVQCVRSDMLPKQIFTTFPSLHRVAVGCYYWQPKNSKLSIKWVFKLF